MYRNTRAHFVFLAVLLGLCTWLIAKVPIRLGIDLQGGTELVYSLDLSRIDRNRGTVAEEVKNVIARRLDVYGLKEISVSVQGQEQLVVQLPGTDSQSVGELKEQIEKAGKLMFRLVASGSEYTSSTAIKQFVEQYRAFVEGEKDWAAKRVADPAFNERRPKPPELLVRPLVEKEKDATGRYRFVTKPGSDRVLWNKTTYNDATGDWDPLEQVSGSFIEHVGSTIDQRTLKPAVTFTFKGEGSALFADLTGNHKQELLAIVLDDDVMQVATIQDRISGSCQLSGNFTDDDVKGIISILRGGSLPTKPVLISESTVGSVLGQDSIESGLMAIAFGLGGVMLIMAIYYMAGGVVANLALALNLLFIYAFVVCFRQTLTLPGIAGMLLTLAMAVDANILIFERFREEKKKGKNLQQSLAAGYDRAFWVIFDSNLTTIITGYVLFYLGTGPVKGFAITLITGLFASFFTSVYVTRVIFSFLCKYGILKEMKMLEAFPTPRIPFTLYQRPFILGSAILIAVTWVCVIFRGKENYGIDFTGGARVTMNLKRPVKVEDMRQKIASLERENHELFRDYSLQTLQASEAGVSRSYALLTRAGARSESKSAKAQEKTEAPPQPAAGQPAAPATPPPAAPAAAPPVSVAPAANAEEPKDEPAQLVRAALEKLLEKEGLLLPPSFPVDRWDPGTAPGTQALTVEVNLAMVREDVTTELLKAELNSYLAKNKFMTTENRGTGVDDYKGLTIDSVALVGKPVEGDPIKLTRYSVKTTAYREPLPGTSADAGIPTHAQVRDAVEAFFKSGAPKGMLQISDPFPQVSTVGPRVASGLQADALVAVFISIVGIVFYLALRFEFIYGLAGVIALVHDCMVAIGVMSVTDLLLPTTFPVKLNLNELAAVLTIIGFSINDTIVLFDRIRENKDLLARKKLTLKDLVDISVNQTLARTLWTSTTVLLVDVILLGFGGDSVRGFAYLFAVGTVAGVYSSVFIAAPIAIWLFDRAEARRKLLATQPVA